MSTDGPLSASRLAPACAVPMAQATGTLAGVRMALATTLVKGALDPDGKAILDSIDLDDDDTLRAQFGAMLVTTDQLAAIALAKGVLVYDEDVDVALMSKGPDSGYIILGGSYPVTFDGLSDAQFQTLSDGQFYFLAD